jgi:hypothetical protein
MILSFQEALFLKLGSGDAAQSASCMRDKLAQVIYFVFFEAARIGQAFNPYSWAS